MEYVYAVIVAMLLLATSCSNSYCPSLERVVTVDEKDFHEISLSDLKPKEINHGLVGIIGGALLRFFVGCHDYGDRPSGSHI